MRIIHLEDDELIAEFVEVLCVGHEYVWVQESRQACELANEAPFDAALIDLGLQRGDHGGLFLEWLAKQNAPTFRILVSGVATLEMSDFTRMVDAQLDKPFTVVQFSRTLENANAVVEARRRAKSPSSSAEIGT